MLLEGKHYCVHLRLVFHSLLEISPIMKFQVDKVILCYDKNDERAEDWFLDQQTRYEKNGKNTSALH